MNFCLLFLGYSLATEPVVEGGVEGTGTKPLNLFLGYREPSEIPVFPGKEHSDLGT